MAQRRPTPWRGVIEEYRDRLPVPADTAVVTLGEGGTPLVAAHWLSERTGCEVWLKVEGDNPTGSFKDRGMTVAISLAARAGDKAVVCASTGNTSASAAAYAVRAGLLPLVLIPAGRIARGKLAQAIVHGAQLVSVDGGFDDCLRIARELGENYPVALVNSVNPVRLEGQKTAAFEVCDALGDAPDLHVLPVGNAGNISAYWKGYSEYAADGLSTRTPQMWGFQAEGGGTHRPRPDRRAARDRGDRDPRRQPRLVAAGRGRPGRVRRPDRGGLRPADPVRPARTGRQGRSFRRTRLGRRGRRPARRPGGRAAGRRPHRRPHHDRPRAEGHRHRAVVRPARRRAGPGHAGRHRRRRPVRRTGLTLSVRVRVPATSANLGPGFDAFGLALTLYDDLSVRVGGTGVSVEVVGEAADAVPRDESHLVVRAIRAGLAELGAAVPGFTLSCHNRIPHGRGLGSSSAAIVGGLTAAYGLTGTPLDRARVLELANRIEGHPDNVAACVSGGFTIAWLDDDIRPLIRDRDMGSADDHGTARAVRLDAAAGLSAVAYVPATPLSTEVARGLLPDVVPHGDASANAGRAALLVAALTSRPDLLFAATEDRLHQAYRAPAMPRSAALIHELRDGGLPAVVSGAGPTVLVLGDSPVPAPEGWVRYGLGIDPVGVQVWSGEVPADRE
jgi:homoserine kinase